MVRAVFWGVRQAICTETCRGSRPFADRFLEGWLCLKCWLSVPLIYRWLELFGAHRVLPPSSVNGKSLWCVLLYWGCGKSSWKWLGTRLKLMKLKIYCKEFSKLLNVGQSYRRIGSLHYGGLHLPGERAGHGRANVAICCHSGENSWEKTQEIGETIEKKGNFTILAFVARGGFWGGGLPFLRNLTGFCFWFCSSLTYIESPESVSLFCTPSFKLQVAKHFRDQEVRERRKFAVVHEGPGWKMTNVKSRLIESGCINLMIQTKVHWSFGGTLKIEFCLSGDQKNFDGSWLTRSQSPQADHRWHIVRHFAKMQRLSEQVPCWWREHQ